VGKAQEGNHAASARNRACVSGTRLDVVVRAPGFDVYRALSLASRVALPVCFVLLSALRLGMLLGGPAGYDARLYRAATLAWLSGGDPWQVQSGGVYFAAPPPTLLTMLPFALLPEAVTVATLMALGVSATIWALRKLEMPLWWLAFPPLVDGLYNANPHVLLVPLALTTTAWLAPIVKIYAAPVLLLRREFRALLVAATIIVLTAPLLPWATFIAELPRIVELLRYQSSGGLSATQLPLLIVPAFVALVVVGRERAAWWVIPALWPSTQYYYNSLAMPAATPMAALVLCAQFPGAAAVALCVSAAELWLRRRRESRAN
jgi:hypothetical protein